MCIRDRIITAPKSRNSIREIPLPGFLVELLKTARKSGQISEEGYVLKGIRKEYTEPRTLQYLSLIHIFRWEKRPPI